MTARRRSSSLTGLARAAGAGRTLALAMVVALASAEDAVPEVPDQTGAVVRDAIAQGRFAEADRLTGEWLKRDPSSSEALRLKTILVRLSAIEPAAGPGDDLRRRFLLSEGRSAVREAAESAARGDHQRAVLRLESAVACLTAALPWEDAGAELAAAQIELARERQRFADADASRQGGLRQQQLDEARIRRDERSQTEGARFAERTRRVRSLLARDYADLALAHARSLVTDFPFPPQADEAQALFDEALARVHVRRRLDLQQREQEVRQEVFDRVERALIPTGWNGLPVFPHDWAGRHPQQTGLLAGDIGTQDWEDRLRDALAVVISLDIDGLDAVDAFALVARLSGVNIVLDPRILAGAQVKVSLRARDMRLDRVIQWLAEQIGAPWSLTNGAVFIGEGAAEPTTISVYDVASLLMINPEGKGMSLAFSADGKGQAVADLFAGGGDAGAQAMTAEDLRELITTTIAPASWSLPGHGVQVRGTMLLVNAPPSVHRLLLEFLKSQERVHNLGVQVRSRWLQLTDRFIEEIGVQWTGDAQSGALIAAPGSTFGASRVMRDSANSVTITSPLPSSAVNGGGAINSPAGSGLTLSSAVLGTWQLNAVLKAVEATAQGREVQSPELITLNGQRASIFIGEQYAYISDYTIVTQNLDPTISVLNTGTFLSVKPVVSADRKYVTLEVDSALATIEAITIEFIGARVIIEGRVTPPGGGLVPPDPTIPPQLAASGGVIYPLELPTVALRQVRTTVMLADRGTLLIGGFSQATEQSSLTRAPFLGAIPFLGRLFGARGRYSDRSQLYLLISTMIIPYDELESRL